MHIEMHTDWVEEMSKARPQFLYWSRVMSLELTVLQFVRSIREGNFALYKMSLAALVLWMFAMDRINYARWLSVHIRDMEALSSTVPDVNEHFKEGSFVVHKSRNAFSLIALDHAHEQQNALVKGDGGAVGLTSNPGALLRWMVAGPEIARVVQEFETSLVDDDNSTSASRHHEQYPSYQASFKKDVSALVSAYEEFGNPFEEDSGDLLVLDSKVIMNDEVVQAIRNAPSIGQSQYKAFVEERFKERVKPITETIKKNKLPLFRAPQQKNVSKDKQKGRFAKE